MFIHEGITYARKYGNRREVWDRVSFMTSGKLQRINLELRNGKLISKKRSKMGKERFKRKNPFVQLEVAPSKKVKISLLDAAPSVLKR